MLPEKIESTEVTEEEEQAFNAATDSLLPAFLEGPLESEEEAPAADAGTEEAEAAREYFLGQLTKEEVEQQLTSIDSRIEAAVQRVFGKFGEVNREIQELKGRNFTFDPEKLAKTKELDEGIAKALAEDLKGAFEGSQVDHESLVDAARAAARQDALVEMEKRFLHLNVRNAEEITKKPKFAYWFYNVADPSVRDTFQAWDEGTGMDSVGMVDAFRAFEAYEKGEQEREAAAQKALKGSTEDRRTTGGASTRRTLTEDEAFNARAKELES